MSISFETVIGSDGVIHFPAGVTPPKGMIEVEIRPCQPAKPAAQNKSPDLVERLLAISATVDWSQMPGDLAENHDYYAHGAPKGIDQQ